jgi:hypothetical protein
MQNVVKLVFFDGHDDFLPTNPGTVSDERGGGGAFTRNVQDGEATREQVEPQHGGG